MKMHLVPVALLALGFSFGCTAESADADPEPTTPKPTSKPTRQPTTPNATPKAAKVENVDAAGAAKLLAENDGVIILDIRTPGEFERGHLKGAVNIDYKANDYAEKLSQLDKEKTYLLH